MLAVGFARIDGFTKGTTWDQDAKTAPEKNLERCKDPAAMRPPLIDLILISETPIALQLQLTAL